MRFAKAAGAFLLTLLVLVFIEWGQYTWIPSLIGIAVAVYVWRQSDPKEKTPHSEK